MPANPARSAIIVFVFASLNHSSLPFLVSLVIFLFRKFFVAYYE